MVIVHIYCCWFENEEIDVIDADLNKKCDSFSTNSAWIKGIYIYAAVMELIGIMADFHDYIHCWFGDSLMGCLI